MIARLWTGIKGILSPFIFSSWKSSALKWVLMRVLFIWMYIYNNVIQEVVFFFKYVQTYVFIYVFTSNVNYFRTNITAENNWKKKFKWKLMKGWENSICWKEGGGAVKALANSNLFQFKKKMKTCMRKNSKIRRKGNKKERKKERV